MLHMDDTDIRTLKHKQSLNVSAIDGAVLITQSVADQKILKGGGGAKDNLSVPSSFIANAHNELYCLLHSASPKRPLLCRVGR